MSYTSFAVNDAMAIKVWSQETAVMERETSEIAKLEGEGDDSIIQVKTDFSKTNGKGDQITYAVRARMAGDGFGAGQRALGNAQALTYYSDAVLISELGNTTGVQSENTIDAQRVPMNLRKDAKSSLVEWWKDRKAAWFFNHVCGYTPMNTAGPGSGTKYTGHNSVTGHTAGRRIWAGTAANDQSLTSADTFTVSLIDRAKELAMLGDNIVKPVMINGQPKHVLYLHPAQVTQLRTDAGAGGWLDITKAAMQGGKVSDSPLYTGALGEWNNVILRQAQEVTQGVNGSTASTAVTSVRRAVMLGQQAAVVAYGGANKYGPMKYRWSEELDDHGRVLEVGAWSLAGMKKVVFNSVDFGCLTISTYAVAQS